MRTKGNVGYLLVRFCRSEYLMSLHGSMPSKFARQPRSLLELDRWKATEFCQLLLYTGLIVLRKVVSKQVYQHFLALSIGISIRLDTNTDRRNFYLQYARELIVHSVSECSWLYGDTFVVYNVHSLIHLADDVQFFQSSLNDIYCFPFQNHMQVLKLLVRNTQNPLVQVVKRLEEFKHSEQDVPTSWHLQVSQLRWKIVAFFLNATNLRLFLRSGQMRPGYVMSFLNGIQRVILWPQLILNYSI